MRIAVVGLLCIGLVCPLARISEARTATGYRGGTKIKLKVVDVGCAEVEV